MTLRYFESVAELPIFGNIRRSRSGRKITQSFISAYVKVRLLCKQCPPTPLFLTNVDINSGWVLVDQHCYSVLFTFSKNYKYLINSAKVSAF